MLVFVPIVVCGFVFLCDFASHYGGLRGVFMDADCRDIGVGQL